MFNFRFGWGARRSGSEPEAFSQSLFIDHTPKIKEVYIFTLLMVSEHGTCVILSQILGALWIKSLHFLIGMCKRAICFICHSRIKKY